MKRKLFWRQALNGGKSLFTILVASLKLIKLIRSLSVPSLGTIRESQQRVVLFGLSYPFLPPHIKIDELEKFIDFVLGEVDDSIRNKEKIMALVQCKQEKYSPDVVATLSASSVVELIANHPSLFLHGSDHTKPISVVRLTLRLLLEIKAKSANSLVQDFEAALLRILSPWINIDFVICTQSNWSGNNPSFALVPRQQRSYKTIMIHYSENDFNFAKRAYVIGKNHMDIHLVWTTEYAHFLAKNMPGSVVKACGPLLFREPRFMPKVREKKTIDVLFYDLTPNEFSFEGPENSENAIQILRMVLGAVERLRLVDPNSTLDLKPKRPYRDWHDSEYVGLVRREVEEEKIRLFPWDTNPFEVISSSSAILVTLGSSPALIARQMKIPVAYVGLKSWKELRLIAYGIPYLCSEDEILSFLLSHCKKSESVDPWRG